MTKRSKERGALHLTFKHLEKGDIPFIVEAFTQIGWHKPKTLFQQYLKEQEGGQRWIWVAFKEKDFAGYVTLKWKSDYEYFRHQGIPEIADLNVLPKFQRQGIASFLLSDAEEEAFKKSATVGIGVGLTADYGKAQKLYFKRGYVPDGRGITYKTKPITIGQSVPLDDDLALWFTKKLESR